MKTIILLLIAASGLLAQQTYPAGTLQVSVDPSGACNVGSVLQYNNVSGKLWGCNGTWNQIGAGGGGSMTWPGTPGISVCTGTPCTAWGTSLTAPTGTIVGTSDTQTLINKTVDGVTPTVFGFLDFSSSGQTQLNAKAPLASPTFTGTPAAPTPSQADNSTKLATTAYVDTLGATKAASNAATTVNGQTCTLGSTCTIPLSAINAQTATYQVLAGDFSAYKTITISSGTFTVTLVASGSQPANGQSIYVINYGSGVVTIARSGQNINGGTTSLTLAAGSATAPTSAKIWSDGTNYFASTSSAGSAGIVFTQRGTTSGKPSCNSGNNGLLYFASDSPLSYQCNGSTYQAYDGTVPVTPPGATSGYTAVNISGSNSWTNAGDTISLYLVVNGTNPIGFTSAATFTPGSSIVTAEFPGDGYGGIDMVCGPAIYQDATHFVIFGVYAGSTNATLMMYSNLNGTVSNANSGAFPLLFGSGSFYRLRSALSTSLVPEYSPDGGQNWFSFPIANLDISGFTTPKMGFMCRGTNNSQKGAFNIRHLAFQ